VAFSVQLHALGTKHSLVGLLHVVPVLGERLVGGMSVDMVEILVRSEDRRIVHPVPREEAGSHSGPILYCNSSMIVTAHVLYSKASSESCFRSLFIASRTCDQGFRRLPDLAVPLGLRRTARQRHNRTAIYYGIMHSSPERFEDVIRPPRDRVIAP
jgi:hypothetical protein